MNHAAVAAHEIVKTYPGGVKALDRISITVGPGEVLGLLGPNGAGKSTTIKILTTLAKPDRGTATVAGFDILRQPDRVRRVIGVVAQRSGLDPSDRARQPDPPGAPVRAARRATEAPRRRATRPVRPARRRRPAGS